LTSLDHVESIANNVLLVKHIAIKSIIETKTNTKIQKMRECFYTQNPPKSPTDHHRDKQRKNRGSVFIVDCLYIGKETNKKNKHNLFAYFTAYSTPYSTITTHTNTKIYITISRGKSYFLQTHHHHTQNPQPPPPPPRGFFLVPWIFAPREREGVSTHSPKKI
jgi:hypothetical protein